MQVGAFHETSARNRPRSVLNRSSAAKLNAQHVGGAPAKYWPQSPRNHCAGAAREGVTASRRDGVEQGRLYGIKLPYVSNSFLRGSSPIGRGAPTISFQSLTISLC